ncbi:transcriptional regulator, GntR family [Anaerococcus hydrogenalis DSM 7454]|uniref:Transcriptional regulator, GntR family n=1 Tax=Anaerococcus hydrogenalis DSM 7454 TaxID=561177 RepID=B6WA31_9FIRM|nr:PLP-dependent aminotransferase family protein [Anaerococcus hydrogenalis]EEB35791.1 transcriptional regulator, GntR family [Anaerococcus hydrogenalis DSM 7454]
MYLNLPKNKKFLYDKIYEIIKNKIIKGEIKEGEKLPSIRNLSKDINVSINTIKKVYYKLEEEGYIYVKDKSGFYCRKIDDLIILDKKNIEEKIDISQEIKYDFSISGVDYENFPYKIMQKYMRESIDKNDIKILDKGSYKGYEPLRNAIKIYLKNSRNIKTNSRNIIISSSTEHLFSIIKNLLTDQTLFAFENPGYAFGNKFYTYDLKNPIPLELDNEGVKIDKLADLNALCLFVTPFHQFPMGTVMSIQRRIELLNWASLSKDRYIIEDDYDSEFKFRGYPTESLKAMDKNSDVIYFGNFSKLLAPSLRISYMVLPDALLEKYERNFKGLSNTVSTFVQKALANFIKSGEFEKHINRMKNIYFKKFNFIVQKLEEIEEISFPERIDSLHLLIKIDKSVDIVKFNELLKEKSLRLINLNRFLYKKNGKENYFILGFANLSRDEIGQGVDLIKEAIEKSK